jgi:spermidine/putrescine transport system substrate-binding protein
MTNNSSNSNNTNKDKLNKLAADNSIPSEIKSLISRSLSRRTVLAGVGGAGAALALASCSSGGTDQLRWANWPEYLDLSEDGTSFPTLTAFMEQSGIDVKYSEVINDNDEFNAPLQPKLQASKDIGYDIVTLTDWMAARWARLGYLQDLDAAVLPNKVNILDSLLNPSFDPGRKKTLTYQGVMGGFGWNKEKIPGGIKSLDQLFAPANKGKVEVISEMRDTMGIILQYQGVDITKPFTEDKFMNAIDFMKGKIADGFIRQVKGNDYVQDLENGDAVAVIGWSGDIFQKALEYDGKFEFAIPESGGTISGDNFMIPVTSTKATEASKLMNYYYDPVVAATAAVYINYVTPVKGAQEAMESIDPVLAKSEFIFPTASTLSRLSIFRDLTAAEETSFQTAFQEASGNI